MKKILLGLFIILSIFTSCKKANDYVFNETPDQRLNAALASYQSALTGAVNGWKAYITVSGDSGGTFGFYFKFNSDNRVNMLSDFDSASAVTNQQSSYRLKAEQQPTLIFDTYSYVHVLSDPNEATDIVRADINHGPVGQGLLSDFEFIFDNAKVKTDTIELIGKVNRSKLLLVRATKADEDAYNSGGLLTGQLINKILTYFKRLTVGAQLYDLRIERNNRKLVFSWLETNGTLVTASTGFYYVAGGINLTKPVVNGGITINGFSNITWNPATETLSLNVGSTPATITGIVVPLKVDVAAPRRWYDYAINNGGIYWISITGFHVNGVDDAFGVQSLTSGSSVYFYMLYYPKFGNNNDAFAPIFRNTAGDSSYLIYGTAPRTPTFTQDGRAIFVLLGDYQPYPATGPAALSRTLLYNPAGYYFVQTDPLTYDMVSAANGKSWITWEWVW